MKSKQQSEIISRLSCAAGHLNAVLGMMEAEQPFEQVLHQLRAVNSEICAAKVRLIISQAQSSQSIILDSPLPKHRLAEFKHLQSLCTIFLEHPNHHNEVSND